MRCAAGCSRISTSAISRSARSAGRRIACDFNYEEAANGPYKPVLRNITVERMHTAHALRVIDSQGLPGAPIGDIALSDCNFDGVAQPSIVRITERLTLDRVRVNGRSVTTLAPGASA